MITSAHLIHSMEICVRDYSIQDSKISKLKADIISIECILAALLVRALPETLDSHVLAYDISQRNTLSLVSYSHLACLAISPHDTG